MLVHVFKPWKTDIYKWWSKIANMVENRWYFWSGRRLVSILIDGKSWKFDVHFRVKKKIMMPGCPSLYDMYSFCWVKVCLIFWSTLWCSRIRPNEHTLILFTPLSFFSYKNVHEVARICCETHFYMKISLILETHLLLRSPWLYDGVKWVGVVLRSPDKSLAHFIAFLMLLSTFITHLVCYPSLRGLRTYYPKLCGKRLYFQSLWREHELINGTKCHRPTCNTVWVCRDVIFCH
jgi:hypothetical protein